MIILEKFGKIDVDHLLFWNRATKNCMTL